MRLQHLQHYIMLIMFGSALLLSVIFSVIAFHVVQAKALEESYQLSKNLMAAVNATASAAVFSGNEALGSESINGLLGNEAIYSVQLTGFADDQSKGMTLSGINEKGGSGLAAITLAIKSPFGEQILGELKVVPNALWVQQNAMDTAFSFILGLIIVIFSTGLLSAQVIKWLIAKPLVVMVGQLQQIKPGGEQRLKLPEHLKANEIGLLVAEFNTMLDRIKHAILVERALRLDMEIVQTNLEKAKQVAEQATQAKSNFLATMSHEIRTPMNSILGFLELTLETPDLAADTRRNLKVADTSAKFLLQLINDILDISKIECGKLELESRSFDLAQLLGEITDLMELKTQEKGLQLNLHCPKKLAPAYRSDPHRLRQILINLVGNAVKFTDQGRVDLMVTQLKHNEFEFSILDTGIGIAADKMDLILKPFTQVDASISRQFGGTGLGTTISSELVQLLGGELKIQSTLGEGSRFFFTIKLTPMAQARDVKSKANTNSTQSRKLKILLVDDDLANISLAMIRLEKAGHDIDTAQNGAEAVAATLETPFDLILMDIQMPIMDGYQATRAIRGQNEHNSAVPILALSANAQAQVQSKVSASGMNGFVVKPIDFSILFETIKQLTKNQDGALASVTKTDKPESAKASPLIDFTAAIEAWMDEAIFHHALHSFFLLNQDSAIEFNDLLGMGDIDQAAGLIHKIKGASGNLRLNRLYQASCLLEAKLLQQKQGKEKQGNQKQNEAIICSTLFKSFTLALSETLASIDALPLPASAVVADAKVPAKLAPQCHSLFCAVIQACEQHDPDAAEEALAQLAQHVASAKLVEINDKLQTFDFSAAVVQLKQLANDLAVEIKTSDN